MTINLTCPPHVESGLRSASLSIIVQIYLDVTVRRLMSGSRYQALSDASNQIRLLKIHPSKGQRHLRYSMAVFDLSRAKELGYCALSYCWCPEGPKKAITVNGVDHKIGFNLWRFLRRLRQSGRTGLLWADALCINQNNVREKSQQVALMGKIYKSASKVLVWIGEECRASGLVLSLSNKCSEDWGPREDTVKQWKALVYLSQRRYWTRIWVIQELLALPHHRTIIYCGLTSTSFKRLRDMSVLAYHQWSFAYTQKKNLVFESGDLRQCGLKVNHSPMAELATPRREGNRLLDLLRRFTGWKCQDERDRVHALLYLADDTNKLDCTLQPDYSKDIRTLITDVFEFYGTRNQESLCNIILWLAPHFTAPSSYQEWIADWPPSSAQAATI